MAYDHIKSLNFAIGDWVFFLFYYHHKKDIWWVHSTRYKRHTS